MQTRLISRSSWPSARAVPALAHVYVSPAVAPKPRCSTRHHAAPESHALSDPADSIVSQGLEAQPLVTQFEAREDEDRETFVTAEGLVEEVEEEDAKVNSPIAACCLTTLHGAPGQY